MPVKKGTKFSEETRRRMSEAHKAFYEENEVSEEHRQKMSNSMKAFWENIDTLKQSNSALKDLKIEDAVTDLAGLPLHDGAIKYYKEVGVLK